jgi:hypothetical protein
VTSGGAEEGTVEDVEGADVDVLVEEDDAELGLIRALFILTRGFNFLFLVVVLFNGAANRSVALIGKVLANFLGRLSSSLDDPPSSASLLTIVPSSVRSPNTDL